MDSVDQDQIAENVQSDFCSTLVDKNIFPPKTTFQLAKFLFFFYSTNTFKVLLDLHVISQNKRSLLYSGLP